MKVITGNRVPGLYRIARTRAGPATDWTILANPDECAFLVEDWSTGKL